MKRCSTCRVQKPYSEFHRQASAVDGHCCFCKPCKSERKKAAYHANPGPAKAKMAEYRKINSLKVAAAKKRCYENKKEEYLAKNKITYLANREERLAKHLVYRVANKATVNARNVRYVRNRMKSDHLFRLTYTVRNRIFLACRDRRITKGTKTSELIGCDWSTLQGHIESQFLPGMSWENRSSWHIDHKIPLSSAKSDVEMFSLCHYTNLQPLWAVDNIKKGAKLPHQLAA